MIEQWQWPVAGLSIAAAQNLQDTVRVSRRVLRVGVANSDDLDYAAWSLVKDTITLT